MRDLHTNLMCVYEIQHKHYSLCLERHSKYHQKIQDNRRRHLHTWVESKIFTITCFLLIRYRISTNSCLERIRKRRQTIVRKNIGMQRIFQEMLILDFPGYLLCTNDNIVLALICAWREMANSIRKNLCDIRLYIIIICLDFDDHLFSFLMLLFQNYLCI